MTAEDVELEHRQSLASLSPAQVRALRRLKEATVRRWTKGGHERDHLRDLFREEAATGS